MISLESIGHAFAYALEKIHAGLQAVENVIPAIQKDATVVQGVTALIPGQGAQTAVGIERVAFGVLGDVAAAVNAADQATLAKGVNVSLDAEVAAAVKALITDFKSQLQTVGLKV
jgi:hypothetical protein